MAAPSYTTDLTTLNTAEATTGWVEMTGYTQTGSPSQETDYFIQGAACISATMSKTGLGSLAYNNGTGVTIPTDGAALIWQYFAAPNALDTEANGGIRLLVGNSLTTFYGWKLSGSDSYAYGGWQCLAIDPTVTPDYTVGTPTTTRQYFGWGCSTIAAVSKGNPFGIDVIRYGRCTAEFVGGDLANGYATFSGFAAVNDTVANRWGLIQVIEGGYKWQGKMMLGHFETAVDFRDSNTSIVVANTKKVSPNFNEIEVIGTSSRVDWTNISFSALGTVSKGRFLTIYDSADINIDGCTFTDMDTFAFRAGCTIIGTTFRRCGQVTLGGATMTSCLITRSTAAIALACAGVVTGLSNTDFISGGTGHAIEITSGTSHTLTGITFTGYAASNGSTGNEAVYVNIPSGSVTIYADSTFSYRTAGATVTIIAGSVTTTVTVTNEAGSVIEGAAVALYAANGTADLPYKDTVTIANSGTTATVSHTAHGMLTNDKVLIEGASHAANRGVFTITVTGPNAYTYTMDTAPGSNPTGTIHSTWTALFGTTDANGQISMSRVFSVNQPVLGWARKSTSSPYYKTGPVSGIISSSDGLSLTALLLSDE